MTAHDALHDILERAQAHPCFSREHFETRFIERKPGDEREERSLIEIGGDVCDWTMIAIIAAAGLKGDR